MWWNHLFPLEFTPLSLTLHISTILKTTTAKGPNCGNFTWIPQTPQLQSVRLTVKKSLTWAQTPKPNPNFLCLSRHSFFLLHMNKTVLFICMELKCKKYKPGCNEIYIMPSIFFQGKTPSHFVDTWWNQYLSTFSRKLEVTLHNYSTVRLQGKVKKINFPTILYINFLLVSPCTSCICIAIPVRHKQSPCNPFYQAI